MGFPIVPVFDNAVTLVCCGDSKFVPLTSVLLQSVISCADPGRSYDLIYLHDGLDADTEEKLLSIAGDCDNVSLRCFDLREVFSGEGLYFANRPGFSAMAFARLLIPQLLADSYRRALYLDGDMLALSDIAELFDTDLCGQPLGAIRDFGLNSMVSANYDEGQYWKDYIPRMLGFSDCENYINSGLLLMDLPLWRQHYPSAALMETATSRKWDAHDQDVINRVFHGHIHYLEPCWGVYDILDMAKHLPQPLQEQYEQAMRSPKLVHFASSNPKSCLCFRSAYSLHFWSAASRSPFYDSLLKQMHRAVQDAGILQEVTRLANGNGCTLPESGSWNRDWENDAHRRLLLFLLLQDRSFLSGGTLLKLEQPQAESSLYTRFYGNSRTSGIRGLISRLLPAPQKNVHRDLQLLQETLHQQEALLGNLVQTVQSLSGAACTYSLPRKTAPDSGDAPASPILPVTLSHFRQDLKRVYTSLDNQARQLALLQNYLQEMQHE